MKIFNSYLKKTLLTVASLVAICAEVCSEKPNIVYIIADDYGFNDIGYHGVDHLSAIKTPFLDSLALDGIKLENYYVQPMCTPSRSQLMSGRYQIHTGLQHSVIKTMQPNGLPLNNILLPEQLKYCGYETHMVGKWHLGFFQEDYLPWNRGFDTYFGFLAGVQDYYQKYQCAKSACGYDMNSENGPTNETYGQYSTHLYADKAKEAIDNHDKSKPMFLYVSFQAAHSPLEVPEEYTEAYSDIQDTDRRQYAGMIAAMDEAVKNITEHLGNAGMWDNTLMVFTSDNGGSQTYGGNNWPLRGRKSTLWEGGIRVAGFVHGNMLNVPSPNVVTNNEMIHVSDWYPTLLSAAQCQMMPGTQPMDGYDQWKTISTYAQSPRTEFLINIDPLSVATLGYKVPAEERIRMGFDTSVLAGIRVGDWKLLTGEQGNDQWVVPPESLTDQSRIKEVELLDDNDPGIQQYDVKLVQLFNIKKDPEERVEVSDLYPEIVDELLTKLAEYNATAVPVNYPADDPNSDPQGGFWQPWMI